ncbi:hypothetical protein EIN_184320 [Entamoeba invadens IP1]|nr:hypothetical protein EIN_184320 [Entamoeba invadens IP1]ELP94085.1 hypothetical protein EIN_184320 [Entamoeba invadens IP1]|eukprot:XP_004260856.1 hypothetical protein EIN_184320 [Entamoeba invadens IP1]
MLQETDDLMRQLDTVTKTVKKLQKDRDADRKNKPKMVMITYKNNGPHAGQSIEPSEYIPYNSNVNAYNNVHKHRRVAHTKQYLNNYKRVDNSKLTPYEKMQRRYFPYKYRKVYTHRVIPKYLNKYTNKKLAKRMVKTALRNKKVEYQNSQDKKLNAFIHTDDWKKNIQENFRQFQDKKISKLEHLKMKDDLRKLEEEEKEAIEEIKMRMKSSELELKTRADKLRAVLKKERENSERVIHNEIIKKETEFKLERNRLRREFKKTMALQLEKLKTHFVKTGDGAVDNTKEVNQLKALTQKVLVNLGEDPVTV